MAALLAAIIVALGLVGVAACVAVAVMLEGFALSHLWAWFVVPYFHVQPLGVALSIGLMLLYRAVRGPARPLPDAKDKSEKWGRVLQPVINPLWILLAGYIVSRFL